MDPVNPTCPKSLNFSTYRQMRFTVEEINGLRVLRAEGAIDETVPERLKAALDGADGVIDEIWVRSPGGNAGAGSAAGKLVRQSGIPTRIPKGWACFSACNFLFMGGEARFIDEGGIFAVHMFTHTGNREAIANEVSGGESKAIALIGTVEQESALLASEDNDFLIRMGISRKLLTDVMYRQKAISEQGSDRSTRRCLTVAEAIGYGVAHPEP
ncbi:hypothetical protein E2493_19030 [Sphingomonas parva]|uniref:Peptidase S14 n=2 Tax=Sphingomonas parva TaxID=2555898 RepID=A0A4Y8ZPB3_9SPHN|nr:hypothetical protein E2493_19030 [Sphingomonas parva]